jgi:hypothetical protein
MKSLILVSTILVTCAAGLSPSLASTMNGKVKPIGNFPTTTMEMCPAAPVGEYRNRAKPCLYVPETAKITPCAVTPVGEVRNRTKPCMYMPR